MELFVVSDGDDVLQLGVKGRIQVTVPSEMVEAVLELLGDQGCRRKVLLNLAETDFIDSSGLSGLLGCNRQFGEAGGKLILHSVPTSVMEVIKVMRLDRVLNLAENESGALAMMSESS